MTCSRGSFDKIGFPFSREAGSILQGVHSMLRDLSNCKNFDLFGALLCLIAISTAAHAQTPPTIPDPLPPKLPGATVKFLNVASCRGENRFKFFI
jgi:hypothetical protein